MAPLYNCFSTDSLVIFDQNTLVRLLCRIKILPVQKVVVVGCSQAHMYAHMRANLGLGKITRFSLG